MKFEIILLIGILVTVGRCSKEEKILFDTLFNDYDPKIRPVKDCDATVKVNFTLTLQQIINLDEKNQILTTSMYPVWKWTDDYLKWDPAKFGNITKLYVPSENVWNPGILVYNSVVDSFNPIYPTRCIIRPNGQVEWLPPGVFKTTCDVDIRYFPFDDQLCKIKFGTWEYDSKAVDLVLTEESATLSGVKSKEWQLMSMNGIRHSIKYDCCEHPFVDITYTLHIRRRTLFYGFNFILPCFLVNSLAILVFLLPADTGERITLNITILLALVVFLQILAEALPPTDTIPLLGNYFASSIVMVTSSVLITVISLNFHHRNAANANAMPKTIRWIFLEVLPRILRIKRPGEISQKRKFIDAIDDVDDPDDTRDENKIKIPLITKQKGKNHENGDVGGQNDGVQREMREISKQLIFITDRIHNDDEDEKCALEWQFAAYVLDSFALWIYIFYFIFTTFLTIGMAPGILLKY